MIMILTNGDPQRQNDELKKRNKQKKIARIKQIIGYIIVLAAAAAGNYIVLVVAANNKPEDSQRWAKNFLLSFAQDLGVNQVIKALVTVILLKILVRRRKGDFPKYFKIFMDLVTMRAIAMASMK